MKNVTWRRTRMGEVCDVGLLHVYLYEEGEQWKTALYPRIGVVIGDYQSGVRLVDALIVSAPHDSSSEVLHEQAILDAEAWLLTNADWLLSAEGTAVARAFRESHGLRQAHIHVGSSEET